MAKFTRTDAHAVHQAMINAQHEAKEREERMPSSAASFDRHAYDLRVVLDKILEDLTEDIRLLYAARPSVREPDPSPAQIEERFGG
jgi:hypothetical protein